MPDHHHKSLPYTAALLALWLMAPAHAQPTAAGTLLSLGGQYDEEDAYSIAVGLDHGITAATWLSLTAGLADAADGPFSLSTSRAGIGLDHYFAPAGVAIDVEYWGDSDAIETLLFAGEVYFRTENARFTLQAARRDIELKYEVPAAVSNLVATSQSDAATGLGGSLRYSWESASLYASAMVWNYDEAVGQVVTSVDLSRVPPLLRPVVEQRLARLVNAVRFLSASSLTLANSLLARSASAGFDYRFGDKTLNLEIGHDRGEVDDLDVNSLSAGWLVPVGETVDLELRVGVSEADTFGTTAFGGISLFFYR